jgi:serine/threonine-protein kinase RsbW
MQEMDQGRHMADPVEITLSIPCKLEYISLCRLAVGAIGAREALDGETIADLKVAVTEAAAWLMAPTCPVSAQAGADPGCPGLTAVFAVSPDAWRIEVSQPGTHSWPAGAGAGEDNLGLTIIEALVDEFDQREDPERGTVLRFVKYLSDHPTPGEGG